MAIEDYKGPSNSSDMFKHLVGETIKGVFEENSLMYIVLSNNNALTLTSHGGECGPAFFVTRQGDLKGILSARKSRLQSTLDAIKATEAFEE